MTAPAPRYVPDFRLRIDGEPIPSTLRASIASVTVQTGLEGADRLELTIVNEALRWLDHPLLRLDRVLAVSLGYLPEGLEQVFVGEVVTRTASFGSNGVPTLTVAAQARTRRMQQGEKVRWFAIPVSSVGNFALPDQATASIVTLENGMVPVFEPVGAALAVLLGGAEALSADGDPDAMQRAIRKQSGESDYDFLGRLSRENGWEMVVDHSGPLDGRRLRFMSPLDRLVPVATLRYGQSLVDFHPRLSTVGQIVSVTAIVWLSAIKTEFVVTVGWDWDRMALTIDISPEFSPAGRGPSQLLIEEPVTPFTAPRRIVSELIPRLNRRLTGSGSTIGDTRIAAGEVVRLEGLGAEFGGLYRVTSATHTIDAGGFRTSFEARKEIWFGSIPLTEQGAVPIHLSAPFAG